MHDLDFIGEEVSSILEKNDLKRDVWKDENLSEFASRSGYAISLIFQEKEILLFSVLQWVAIAVAYYIWIQILGWIPNEVWESDSKIHDVPLNITVFLWSLFCVALAAYPISILTGAMGAAHFLRQQGYESTIAACFKLALPNSKKLWIFHTWDGWLTVDIIVERLPKSGYFTDAAERALKEALYYAWKVGTIGVPAALLTGKGLAEAGKESIALVKAKLWDVIKLRGGYSMACWIIGIVSYIGAIAFFITFNDLFKSEHTMFKFYFWMGAPLLIAVGIIKLFIRPIYVIASCKLYSDYLLEQGKPVEFKNLPSRGQSAFVAFLVLCVILIVIFLYREQLGLMDILRVAN